VTTQELHPERGTRTAQHDRRLPGPSSSRGPTRRGKPNTKTIYKDIQHVSGGAATAIVVILTAILIILAIMAASAI
jgi:hypothetical protein